MSRPRQHSPGGMVFHVLNRGVGRRVLFTKDEDFLAFERVVEETLRTRRMRLCAYCLMSNHWHFVVWPERDGDLPAFMQQVTNTHVKRWKEHRHEIGYGHLYQGRYKCFRSAFCRLARAGWRSSRVHAASDQHACETVEGASSRDRVRPSLSRALQVFQICILSFGPSGMAIFPRSCSK